VQRRRSTSDRTSVVIRPRVGWAVRGGAVAAVGLVLLGACGSPPDDAPPGGALPTQRTQSTERVGGATTQAVSPGSHPQCVSGDPYVIPSRKLADDAVKRGRPDLNREFAKNYPEVDLRSGSYTDDGTTTTVMFVTAGPIQIATRAGSLDYLVRVDRADGFNLWATSQGPDWIVAADRQTEASTRPRVSGASARVEGTTLTITAPSAALPGNGASGPWVFRATHDLPGGESVEGDCPTAGKRSGP